MQWLCKDFRLGAHANGPWYRHQPGSLKPPSQGLVKQYHSEPRVQGSFKRNYIGIL